MIERHLSSGFNDRRIIPTGICIHYISGRYTQPDDPYDPDEIIRILEEYGFAYHDLITREGEVIELVPAPLRAWHAGESSWHGREDCNSFMLGIALAGMYETPFTDPQYDALAQRTAQHVQRFRTIRRENIAGHEDVAPDRKRDPGPGFQWDRYLHAINGLWEPRGIT